MTKLKQESIADFLRCASILEERAYLLYKSLADKVNLPLINSLLLHIAFDSRKHSIILKGISESIAKQNKQPRDCEKRLFLAEPGRQLSVLQERSPERREYPEAHVVVA